MSKGPWKHLVPALEAITTTKPVEQELTAAFALEATRELYLEKYVRDEVTDIEQRIVAGMKRVHTQVYKKYDGCVDPQAIKLICEAFKRRGFQAEVQNNYLVIINWVKGGVLV